MLLAKTLLRIFGFLLIIYLNNETSYAQSEPIKESNELTQYNVTNIQLGVSSDAPLISGLDKFILNQVSSDSTSLTSTQITREKIDALVNATPDELNLLTRILNEGFFEPQIYVTNYQAWQLGSEFNFDLSNPKFTVGVDGAVHVLKNYNGAVEPALQGSITLKFKKTAVLKMGLRKYINQVPGVSENPSQFIVSLGTEFTIIKLKKPKVSVSILANVSAVNPFQALINQVVPIADVAIGLAITYTGRKPRTFNE